MSRRRAASAVIALTLILAACGGSSTTESTEAAATEADAGNAETERAVDGVFATVAGGELDIGALEGQDTVLWFWAPW